MIDGIKLVRVDFRLIHGQVITKWSNIISAKEIIVVNDQLSKDEYMAEIYIMAAPPGMKVNVLSINDFVTQAKNNAYASGNVLVLFKNIKDARDTVDMGIPFKQVQVVRGADRIYVIDKGRVVECGDHAGLMKQQGLYARLAKSQDLDLEPAL